MKLRAFKFLSLFITAMFFAAVPTPFAGVNMDLQHKLTMDSPPLDVVATPDGKHIFVLTNTGHISVFDSNGVFQNKIHVGDNAQQIKMDPKGNRLLVTSPGERTVRVIALDFFVEINTAGSPAKGPKNAPVVLAVFSDFQ